MRYTTEFIFRSLANLDVLSGLCRGCQLEPRAALLDPFRRHARTVLSCASTFEGGPQTLKDRFKDIRAALLRTGHDDVAVARATADIDLDEPIPDGQRWIAVECRLHGRSTIAGLADLLALQALVPCSLQAELLDPRLPDMVREALAGNVPLADLPSHLTFPWTIVQRTRGLGMNGVATRAAACDEARAFIRHARMVPAERLTTSLVLVDQTFSHGQSMPPRLSLF